MKMIAAICTGIAMICANPDSLIYEVDEHSIIMDETKFFGDQTIAAGTVNNDHIRIVGGDLFVYGTVDGKVTVVGGDVTLGPTAIVNGTIVAIGGKIIKDEQAIVNGKVIETHLKEGLVYREMEPAESETGEPRLKIKERSLRSTESWIHPEKDLFIYNRNEGLAIHINHTWDGAKKSSLRINTTLGYRMGSEEGIGRLSLEKGFFTNNNLILFASAYKESRTDDFYRLPEDENSWAGVLARQDFYDRWDEEGWSAGLGLDLNRIRLKLMTAAVKIDTIPVQQKLWSLFDKDRDLRINPSFEQQKQLHYLQATAAYQSKNYSLLNSGMALFLQAEVYQPADETEKIYTLKSAALKQRIFGFIRMNWEWAYGIVLRTQFMAGTSDGKLDDFRKFGMGGLGSVSTFPFKYQTGDQMLQLNGEIIFTEDFTDSWYFFKLFADGGYAWTGASYNFNQQNFMDFGISSAGIGFGSADDQDMDWSVNVARRLDGSETIETTYRLNYNF